MTSKFGVNAAYLFSIPFSLSHLDSECEAKVKDGRKNGELKDHIETSIGESEVSGVSSLDLHARRGKLYSFLYVFGYEIDSGDILRLSTEPDELPEPITLSAADLENLFCRQLLATVLF